MNNTGEWNDLTDKLSYKEVYDIINSNNKIVENKFNEINNKLNKLIDKTEAIHVQATMTNGRVNACEERDKLHTEFINELKKHNQKQDKEIRKMVIKYTAITAVIIIIVYLTTGVLLPI